MLIMTWPLLNSHIVLESLFCPLPLGPAEISTCPAEIKGSWAAGVVACLVAVGRVLWAGGAHWWPPADGAASFSISSFLRINSPSDGNMLCCALQNGFWRYSCRNSSWLLVFCWALCCIFIVLFVLLSTCWWSQVSKCPLICFLLGNVNHKCELLSEDWLKINKFFLLFFFKRFFKRIIMI